MVCLPSKARNPSHGEIGLVSWVQDDSTLVIDFQGQRDSLRLLGLDAPPIAARKLRELTENQVVRVFARLLPALSEMLRASRLAMP